ncbi:MAG: hypothetical protein GX964_07705 [Syntrophomonadaceae bacterium]|jgi:hypothetical protein|nr:hypothetical protein [Syntrophomonadaceae bacterium]
MDGSPEKQPEPRTTALGIAIVYLFVGTLWILLSDKVLVSLINEPAMLTRLSMCKGWFFVIITAWVLYVFIHRLSPPLSPGLSHGKGT